MNQRGQMNENMFANGKINRQYMKDKDQSRWFEYFSLYINSYMQEEEQIKKERGVLYSNGTTPTKRRSASMD